MKIDRTIEKLSFFKKKWKLECRDAPRSARIRARTLPFAFPIFLAMIILHNVEGSERREDIINGQVNCIDYDNNDGHGVFSLVCPEFDLRNNNDFTNSDYITLEKNEVFEGNDNQVLLPSGEYEGLFKISEYGAAAPSSLEDAPVIRHLYMTGGRTATNGGFLIQKEQKHFIVDSCSSTGIILGSGSGGVCGSQCSGDILITNCSSSGTIGHNAGGIAGQDVGLNGNDDNANVTITLCHSEGVISGASSGGICGNQAGRNGHLVITKSYSTGRIGSAQFTGRVGGVCGGSAASNNGLVKIDQCYSEGPILGESSGGIVGRMAGSQNGVVHITNSYSRGEISGNNYAGGIAGYRAGASDGTVLIANVYASGEVTGPNAGGIIGYIDADAKEIKITMSVHNDGPIVFDNKAGGGILTTEKNSGNFDKIDGTIYCYENDECWDETIWNAVPYHLPYLQFRGRFPDRRQGIIDGTVACVEYDGNTGIFSLVCPELELLSSSGLDMDEYITLQKNEVFEGNDNKMLLNGEYKGLFKISDSEERGPFSLEDAPIIRNLHMTGGETERDGGFFIQVLQNNFIIDSCSSSGEIKGEISGDDAGGITGDHIAHRGNDYNANVTITHCHSTGNMTGWGNGGVTGYWGADHGHLVITDSYSLGNIAGLDSGGIVGWGTAYQGIVTIKQCYSEGEISGDNSGGIVAGYGGYGGFIEVKECYSEGKISGEGSGGIAGSSTGYDGIAYIMNSYSRGDIARHAGGVCGRLAGEGHGIVIITNVYASGSFLHEDAGGIIGHIDSNAKEISITMSVYNDETIVGKNDADGGVLNITKSSGDLGAINGIIYCYENGECWDDETIWEAVPNALPILQFQQLPPSEILPCCTRDSENYLFDCDDCPEHTIFTELQFTKGFLPGAFKDLPATNRSIRILEIRRSDFKKIQRGALEGLDALETLRITDSSLDEIEDGTFAAHYTPNLKNILLARNQLLELPEELFWGIAMDRLDVRGNQIRLIPRNLFHGQQIISLADFRNNHIDFMIRTEEPLEKTLFEGTKFLDFFVDGNPGHDECPEGSVLLYKELNMENLEVVMDDFCEIPRCEDSARFCFATLRPEPTCCLVETDLNSGKQTLKYCKCPDESVIDLSCHGIEELADGAFDHYENYNVTQINLNSNFLIRLRMNGLSGLPSLHTLYLGNNTIASIDDGSFQGIPSLRHLHLDLNKITEIDSLTLHGLIHLVTLTAMDNKIEKVGINSFHDTTKIESIYLSRNSLCELPVHGLQALPNLLEVELMENPGYRNCTKAGEIYGNGANVIHSFEKQCLQLIDLEFCFST